MDITVIPSRVANCYLLRVDGGFILVDTGIPFTRGKLQKALAKAGCRPGGIRLVIATHLDFDHTGNCRWLQKKYNARIAMHPADGRGTAAGDMMLTRHGKYNWLVRAVMGAGARLIFRRFQPDVSLQEGDSLSAYGLEAKILEIPGHTGGSIGVLTGDGAFFCGDLINGGLKPAPGPLVDDPAALNASISRLKELDIKTVYPGHGHYFAAGPFFRSFTGAVGGK